jgi:hypothetical protein
LQGQQGMNNESNRSEHHHMEKRAAFELEQVDN